MNPNRNQRILIIAFVLIGLAIIISFALYANRSSKQKPATGPTTFDINPPQDVTSVIGKYLQARENSVGADQTSPSAWLGSVKPITTSAWFAQLQPSSGVSTTSTVSNEYRVAHESGYVVKAAISNCTWVTNSPEPIKDSGVVRCELADTTLAQATGNPIQPKDLPFGWAHNGPQPAAVLKVIKQNGNWLIDGESASGGE
jgi:hypothetical protein